MKHYFFVLLAAISISNLYAGELKTKPIFLEDFSKWATVDSLPEGWDCKGNILPSAWEPVIREKQPAFTAQVLTDTTGKQSALWLNGKIRSKGLFDIQDRQLFTISFRAKGADGNIVVELNEIGIDKKSIKASVEVCQFETKGQWKQYSSKIKILPFSIRHGQLELVGKNVIIDDICITPFYEGKVKKAPLPKFTIPVINKSINVDGKMDRQEWRGSVGMEKPFVNTGTGLTVNRSAAFRMFSDGTNLNIYVRANNYKRSFVSNAKKKDGDVFQDDSLEFYFNPHLGEKRPVVVYFIAINAKGIVLDMAEKVSIAQYEHNWDCKELQTKTYVEKDVWHTEMSLPLASVGLSAGTAFGFNISRNMLFPQEYSNLTGSGYKDYLRMATCVIKPAPGIFWNFYSQRGEVKGSASIINSLNKEIDIETTMGSEFKKKKEQKRTLRLASKEEDTIKMAVFEGYSATGDVSLQVTGKDTHPLFQVSRRLVLGTRNTPVSEDAVGTDSRNFVDYYPAQRKVNILFKDAGQQNTLFRSEYAYTSVFISHDGKEVYRKDIPSVEFANDDAHVSFPFKQNTSGTYKLKAAVFNKEETCISVAYGTFEIRDMPWLGNSLGNDTTVIPPFSPITVKGNSISCWGRTYTFGANALPVTILSQGHNAISAPIELKGALNGSVQQTLAVIEPFKIDHKEGDKVRFSATLGIKNLQVKVHGSIEYDGMTRYSFELLPNASNVLDTLSLTLPVTELEYMHTSANRRYPIINIATQPDKGDYKSEGVPVWHENYDYSKFRRQTLYFPEKDGIVWSSKGIKSKTIIGDFLSFFWLGNTKSGLFWCADNDKGWNCDQQKSRYRLVRNNGTGTLHVDFINKKTDMNKGRIITFALAATPVRPHVKGANAVFKTGSEGFNNPNMQGIQGIRFRNDNLYYQKKFRTKEKERGLPAHLYFANDLLAKNDPALKHMGKEWFSLPYFELGDQSANASWLERRFSSDRKDYACAYTTAVPSRTDYYLHWIDKYMEQKAIDGIYMDNSFPAATINIHQGDGGGYVMDDGTIQGGYSLFETRNLLKRVAVLANKHECTRRHVSVHVTGATMPGIFSFSEWWLNGEDTYDDAKDFMDYWKLPILEIQGAGAMGGNLAWMPLAIKSWGNPTPEEKKKTRTALGALKLFDINVEWGKIDYKFARKLKDIEKEFGIDKPDCNLIGYWDKSNHKISNLPKGVKCSYYVRPKVGALIYMTNFNREKVTCRPSINFSDYGLDGYTLVDAETGIEIKLLSGQYTIKIEKRDFRLLKLETP